MTYKEIRAGIEALAEAVNQQEGSKEEYNHLAEGIIDSIANLDVPEERVRLWLKCMTVSESSTLRTAARYKIKNEGAVIVIGELVGRLSDVEKRDMVIEAMNDLGQHLGQYRGSEGTDVSDRSPGAALYLAIQTDARILGLLKGVVADTGNETPGFEYVRADAIRTIGTYAPYTPEYVELIESYLHDDSEWVATDAQYALEELRGEY